MTSLARVMPLAIAALGRSHAGLSLLVPFPLDALWTKRREETSMWGENRGGKSFGYWADARFGCAMDDVEERAGTGRQDRQIDSAV